MLKSKNNRFPSACRRLLGRTAIPAVSLYARNIFRNLLFYPIFPLLHNTAAPYDYHYSINNRTYFPDPETPIFNKPVKNDPTGPIKKQGFTLLFQSDIQQLYP